MVDVLCVVVIKLVKVVNYCSVGMVEFVYDSLVGQFFFFEVNMCLQVEYGVIEQVWGVDLVCWMIELVVGDLLLLV